MLNWQRYSKQITNYQYKPLLGDWVVILLGIVLVIFLFATLWQSTPASQLQIRQGNQIVGTYTLNQNRTIHVHGPLGDSIIQISHAAGKNDGQVRFIASPCSSQYCVHQGWLKRAGQVAVCLPNQVSIELLGEKKPYDSLSY